MSLAKVATYAVDGISACRVDVEVDIRSRGLPSFTVVGLPDKSVREARERVKAGLTNSGFVFPDGRITVNLAPAWFRKGGASFDLPLAVAILAASNQIDPTRVETMAVVGELSLGGDVTPVHGALAMAEAASSDGLTQIMLPAARAREAALVDGLGILPVESIIDAVAVIEGFAEPAPIAPLPAEPLALLPEPDFIEVRGHDALLPAVEVAAAGGHNLFLHGPPGTGKTMIARRIPTILPPLAREEAIEITRIYSVAGLHGDGGLVTRRPFRAPHHTISAPGLIGGGSVPRPGEITLAHLGVLFLDELAEFNRGALEALRQPLEDGRVLIVRAQRNLTFPTQCMLVAASNPCPCGLESSKCRCTDVETRRYQNRLSGPLLDRIDISIHVKRPPSEAMKAAPTITSAQMAERVRVARERQIARFEGTGVSCNAHMSARLATERGNFTQAARDVLLALHDAEQLSARGYTRVLRVARTVADLDGSDLVTPDHVQRAAQHRMTVTPKELAA